MVKSSLLNAEEIRDFRPWLLDMRASGSAAYHTKVIASFRSFVGGAPPEIVIIELGTELGDWLSQRYFGHNRYDSSCDNPYLWECPIVILQAMLLYYDSDGYADLKIEEFIKIMADV